MSLIRTLAASALLLGNLAGCADSDGDGLSNSKEKKYGTDPELVDSDGDGIEDAREVELGLDPAVGDTDGDGYLDGDEEFEGTDPLDPESKIYKGGWPYQRNKDDFGNPDTGWNQSPEAGARIPRVTGVDFNGDEVDLYDFAGHGKPILVVISAQWCPTCQDLAEDLSDDSGPNPLKRAINQGDAYLVEFLSEDRRGDPAVRRTTREWHNAFPNDNIPVLVDNDHELIYHFTIGQYVYFPTVLLLNPDMTIHTFEYGGSSAAISALLEMVGTE